MLYVGVACAVVLAMVVVLVYLLPASAGPSSVTIRQFDWTIAQGTWLLDNQSRPWFVASEINLSGPGSGYPFSIDPGGAFNVSLVLVVADPQDVPVCSVSVEPPLHVVSTYPPLPARMQGGEDNLLQIALEVSAPAGATVDALGVVDSLGCSLPPL